MMEKIPNTPWDWAREVPSVLGFEQDLRAHLHSGHVVGCAQYVVLFRPVRKNAAAELLLNPWWSDPAGDTWYLWLMAGDGQAALKDLAPGFPRKKWLAFQTGIHPPKFIEFHRLFKLWRKAATKQH